MSFNINLFNVRDREQVEDLVGRQKQDVNMRGERGLTPLHCAKTPEVALALLRAGAKMETTDDAGATPLHRHCESPGTGIASLLVDQGADVREKFNGSSAADIVANFYQALWERKVRHLKKPAQRLFVKLLGEGSTHSKNCGMNQEKLASKIGAYIKRKQEDLMCTIFFLSKPEF